MSPRTELSCTKFFAIRHKQDGKFWKQIGYGDTSCWTDDIQSCAKFNNTDQIKCGSVWGAQIEKTVSCASGHLCALCCRNGRFNGCRTDVYVHIESEDERPIEIVEIQMWTEFVVVPTTSKDSRCPQ